MQPVRQAVLLSWSVPPAASLALALTTLVYLRGWILLRRAGVPFVPPWRAASFLLGTLSLWIALASPFDTFSGFVLTAHMLQHMMLMMVAPPLLLLGAPLIPLVRGLPIFAAREFAGPFLNWRPAIRAGHALTRPVPALLLMAIVMYAWHTPRLYELALASGGWHEVEHAFFLVAALIFWWPVVQPWPSRAQWPRWAVVPYLMIGDLQNTILSAILVFSDRVIYPSYASAPRLFGFSALHDQAATGAIMWVIGSLAFVVPAVVIALQCLSSRRFQMPVAAVDARETALLKKLVTASRRLAFAGGFVSQRWSSRSIEVVTFLVVFTLAGLGLAALASNSSSDDDDQVQLVSQKSGPFAVTVFGPKGEVESGAAEFSILVQNPETQQVLRDAIVDLRAEQQGQASEKIAVRATTEDSENKLLQSGSVNLPVEGDWTLHAAVRRGEDRANLTLPLHVIKPDTSISPPWPYLVLLAFSGVLFLAYWRRHWTRRPQSALREQVSIATSQDRTPSRANAEQAPSSLP